MDDDGKKHSDQFDAALPLPIDDAKDHNSAQIDHHGEAHSATNNAAADVIRKRVEAAYKDEPGANTEAADIKKLGESIERSKHQEFIYELTSSGKPLHEINIAWHEYYAGLPEAEKHEVWQEFYNTHAQASHFSEAIPTLAPQATSTEEELYAKHASRPLTAPAQPLKQLRNRLKAGRTTPKAKAPSAWHSLAFGLGIGFIVLFIFLFGFFNERFIAPFIQPSRNMSGTPIISGSVVGPNPEIIIPKINVEIPVDYSLTTNDDNAVENALENGVVHYADTAMPGQDGNLVIVGHSSNNIFNPGKYKFAFVLLSRLDSGDTFYLQKDGKRYTYQIYKKEIVNPTSVSVLGPQDKTATATLITCDPPGTSRNRLVVVGEQIDPSPTSNLAQAPSYHDSSTATIIPGNSPTLWSRLVKWLSE